MFKINAIWIFDELNLFITKNDRYLKSKYVVHKDLQIMQGQKQFYYAPFDWLMTN